MECKVKDISINYEVIGIGKPIIILHGYYVDHRAMTACMEPVFKTKNNYKRIYIDLPGMGKSGSAEWITSSDNMLDIVIDFINQVIPDENFLVAGYSYGGYLSRGIINKIGNRVEGLLLLCPVIIADYNKRNNPKHIILKKDNKLQSEVEPSEVEFFNSALVMQSEGIWNRFRKEILSGIGLADNSFLSKIKNNGYEFSFNVDELKEKFNKPVLLILGRQDSTVGYKDAFEILDNYPRATFAVLDKAGHHLHIEQEDLFTSLAIEWITRVEES